MPASLPSTWISQSIGVVSDLTARLTDSPCAIDNARPSSPEALASIKTTVSAASACDRW